MIIYVTERVDRVPGYGELRDAIDQRWVPCIRTLFGDAVVIPVPNDLDNLRMMLGTIPPAMVVLTGGNDLPVLTGAVNVAPERDQVEYALVEYVRDMNLPLLAVCRGFQYLNVLLGGSLDAVEGHIANDHEVGMWEPGGQFKTAFFVNSYHRAAISLQGLAKSLIPKLFTIDGFVEAAEHQKFPWLGVMWHPERTNPHQESQMQFIRSFFHIYGC